MPDFSNWNVYFDPAVNWKAVGHEEAVGQRGYADD